VFRRASDGHAGSPEGRLPTTTDVGHFVPMPGYVRLGASAPQIPVRDSCCAFIPATPPLDEISSREILFGFVFFMLCLRLNTFYSSRMGTAVLEFKRSSLFDFRWTAKK